MRIYTPNQPVTLPTLFNKGEIVDITILKTNETRRGKVVSFPKNSAHDTDSRMTVESINKDWFGRLTISEESNDYGNFHISEVSIKHI